MNRKELISALKGNSLQMDFAQMTFTQRTEKDPVKYTGKGYVRQNGDGEITFKVFTTTVENIDKYKSLQKSTSGVSGTIIPEERYYDATLKEYDGHTWASDRILLRDDWGLDPHPIVHGVLHNLRSEQEVEEPENFIGLHFFSDVDLAFDSLSKYEGPFEKRQELDTAKFSAEDIDFTIYKQEGELIVRATSEAPMPSHIDVRIQETLQFITAKRLPIRAVTRIHQKLNSFELRSTIVKQSDTSLSAPISLHSLESKQDTWKLFSSYLAYVMRQGDHDNWNPATFHLSNACQSTIGNLEVGGTGISLAVEGLVTILPFAPDESERQTKNDMIKATMEIVNSDSRFVKLSKRLDGLLASLHHTSAKDRMYLLAGSGHVDKRYVKAWSDLRNRLAHPRIKDLKRVDTAHFQKKYDQLNCVTTLMYQVVFCLIGYTGRFTDYGTRNYLMATYPLAVPEAQDEARDLTSSISIELA